MDCLHCLDCLKTLGLGFVESRLGLVLGLGLVVDVGHSGKSVTIG